MKVKSIFSNWTQIAGLLLIGGALAWTLKLSVIISTNGRIIDTGAAALLMKIGLLLLLVGSTGIGHRYSRQWPLLVRTLCMLVSPLAAGLSFFLFAWFFSPLFQNLGVWYAQQEAPIALAVIYFLPLGWFLYRSHRAVSMDHFQH